MTTALGLIAFTLHSVGVAAQVREANSSSTEAQNIACGPAALSMAARLLDRPIADAELRRAFKDVDQECSLLDIRTAAHAIGLHTLATQRLPAAVSIRPVPAVVSFHQLMPHGDERGHFAVAFGQLEGGVQIIDYPNPPVLMPYSVFRQHCDGVALYIARDSNELQFLNHASLARLSSANWIALAISCAVLVALLVKSRLASYRKKRIRAAAL